MSRAWMPLYIKDYMAKTGHLSTAEHGCYLLLIMYYWLNDGLPDDDRRLAQICRCRLEDWNRHYKSVMLPFFGSGWVHTRISTELARASEISNKRKGAALQMHSKRTANADTFTFTKKEDGANAPSPEKQFFDRCEEILGPKGRSLGAKLLAAKKRDVSAARLALETAATKSKPREYVGGILRGAQTEQDAFWDPLASVRF